MGCDIHFFVEVRKDGKWVTADTWETDDEFPYVSWRKRFYDGRNYNLFAVLAGVRNYFGIAPIADQRGVPDDACSEYKAHTGYYGTDGHSHSWLTLAELLAYDWTQVFTHTAQITWRGFVEWTRWRRQNGEAPEAFAMGISSATEHIDMTEADNRLSEMANPELASEVYPNTLVNIQWEMPYHKACATFWSEAIPRLLRLGKPDDVRILFFFDS